MLEREIAALKRELHGARGLAEAERQTVFLCFILCIFAVVFCVFLFMHQSTFKVVLLYFILYICVVVFCAFLLMHQSTFKVVLIKTKKSNDKYIL